MITEGISEKARELGRLIGQTDEYKALGRARERFSDDRAAVERQQQHAIRVSMHDAAHRRQSVLAERVAVFANRNSPLFADGDHLHPDRT